MVSLVVASSGHFFQLPNGIRVDEVKVQFQFSGSLKKFFFIPQDGNTDY